ncbi:MAG TPA: hypothetical protein PKC45_01460 [Gemmatales bacterium]|nr:hypothetical protein [Gemmatales bacterium]
MRSLVWVTTLTLVATAVAAVATVEYRRRCCGPVDQPACPFVCSTAEPQLIELSGTEPEGDELAEALRDLQVISSLARVETSPWSEPEASALRLTAAVADEFTFVPPTPREGACPSEGCGACAKPCTHCQKSCCEKPAPAPKACSSCCVACMKWLDCCNWQRCLVQALNKVHCNWAGLKQSWRAAQTPAEPPRQSTLLENVGLPLAGPEAAPVDRDRAKGWDASQIPTLLFFSAATCLPVDADLVEMMDLLFRQTVAQTMRSPVMPDRTRQAYNQAGWNAEQADDGNAVLQAAFTAFEPEQIEVANLVVSTRFYPVGEMLAAGQSMDQLIEEICRTVSPRTWESQGGLGSIVYYGPGRTLLVRQTPAVHEQLDRFFSKPRRALPKPEERKPEAPATDDNAGGAAKGERSLYIGLGFSAERGLELELVVSTSSGEADVRVETPLTGRAGASAPRPEPKTPERLPSCCPEQQCPAPAGQGQGCGTVEPPIGVQPTSPCPCQPRCPTKHYDSNVQQVQLRVARPLAWFWRMFGWPCCSDCQPCNKDKDGSQPMRD